MSTLSWTLPLLGLAVLGLAMQVLWRLHLRWNNPGIVDIGWAGGMMPGADLLDLIHSSLRVTEEWLVSGQHYQKTAEAWLRNMDRHRGEILEIFARVYGPGQAQKWWAYWRASFMACAELWGFREGSEWMVAHALLQPRA